MADPTAPPLPQPPDPAELQSAISEQDAALADIDKQKNAALDPIRESAKDDIAKIDKTLAEPAKTMPLPENMAKHLDPKQLNDTASIFMTLGALGGLLMRQPLTAALNNMTAAMKGVQEGDAEQFDRATAEFKTNFDKAMKVNDAAEKERTRILNDTKLSLTEKMNLLDIEAVKYGDMTTRATGTFKGKVEIYKAKENAAKEAREKYQWWETLQQRIQEHRDREQDVRMRMAEMGESRAAREANTIEGKYGQFEDLLKNGKINQEQFDQAVEHLTGVKSGSTMRSQALRVQMAANQVSKSLESIVGLPIGTSSGFFGNRTTSGGGLLASSKETLTNKATEQEVQSYRVMAQGLQRSLATLEAGGVATGLVGLTKQMDGVILQDGDTNMTKLNKLAETRQIFEGATEVLLSEPGIPKEQKVQIQGAFDKVKKLIPFTQSDLNKLQYSSKGTTTLGDVVGKTATAAGVKSQGPTLQEFMQKAKSANPNATEKELSDYYKNKYGGN